MPSRNSKTNNFKNRRAEFGTRVNLSKKESIKAMPPNTQSDNNNNNNIVKKEKL
jgi:hypothetical protein